MKYEGTPNNARWKTPNEVLIKMLLMRFSLTLVASLSLASTAFADVASPFSSRVPLDVVFEVDRAYPDYRFWLVSPRGLEPLALSPGDPQIVDGNGRNGSIARVAAVPRALVEQLGEKELADALQTEKKIAGVLFSNSVDIAGSVPFYDSRSRVIERYQLEIVSPTELRLVFLGQNDGSRGVKIAWVAAGLCLATGIVWGGWRLLRLFRRRLTK